MEEEILETLKRIENKQTAILELLGSINITAEIKGSDMVLIKGKISDVKFI